MDAPSTPDAPKPKHELVICVGSACYARGNARTAPAVLAFLQAHGLTDEVQVTATLCQNRCRQGPNLCLDGECLCGVTPETVSDLLASRLSTGP